MKIASVVGARPNFIKLAPVHASLKSVSDHVIVHTGQHYDYKLSEIFFKELNIPVPDHNLDVGSGSPMQQIGDMVKGLENIFTKSAFDLVIVYGDTNSTFAGALAAMRTGIKVAHIEAGLRSFDRRMPEEINRLLTDQLSDYLFAPTKRAVKNLNREHVYGEVIYSGDVSVEVLREATKVSTRSPILNDLCLEPKAYTLFTMHRAENTVSDESLIAVLKAFETLSDVQIVFPIHPRTRKILQERHLLSRLEGCKNVKLIEPVGYIDFVRLMQQADKIVTDSGGAQKESYMLHVPCITIRENTEWEETVKNGWNKLVGTDTEKIVRAVRRWSPRTAIRPVFGKGDASKIIAHHILKKLRTSVAVS
jgi:UDP-N-acetylglucosamine 2-epimerase (non-hydrolysing)